MRRMAMVSTITSSSDHVGKFLGDLVAFLDEHAAAELEDRVLMDGGEALLALAGDFKGGAGDVGRCRCG